MDKLKYRNKIKRHFAYDLIQDAVNNEWEEIELANLIHMIANNLQFNSEQLTKCLIKTNSFSSAIIVQLLDLGHEVNKTDILSLLRGYSNNSFEYIKKIDEALECGLIDVKDNSIIQTIICLHNDFVDDTDEQFSIMLCSHSKTKKRCANILEIIAKECFETTTEQVHFMYDVISLDFFLDLRGTTHEFYEALKDREVSIELKEYIEDNHETNEMGDVLESDEDSEGNLRDFVVPDEEKGKKNGVGMSKPDANRLQKRKMTIESDSEAGWDDEEASDDVHDDSKRLRSSNERSDEEDEEDGCRDSDQESDDEDDDDEGDDQEDEDDDEENEGADLVDDEKGPEDEGEDSEDEGGDQEEDHDEVDEEDKEDQDDEDVFSQEENEDDW